LKLAKAGVYYANSNSWFYRRFGLR